MATIDIARLSNNDLITETRKAAGHERAATAQLVALLAEFDSRQLYLGQGYPSLFAWCTGALHLAEHAAYHRIEAARAARRFPVILDRLAEGAVTLTAIGLLRQHFTDENHLALLDAARHQSKREVERIIVGLAPKADVPPLVRRLAVIKPLSAVRHDSELCASAPVRSPAIGTRQSPEAPVLEIPPAPSDTPVDRSSTSDRYLLRLTIDGDTHAKLQRARDLLRHTIPDGDPATIVDRALTLLIEQLERAKAAATPRPRADRPQTATTRHIPAGVRRAVWARDGGRCTFVGAEGRCRETGRLEFHHVTPYARGGRTDTANLALRCRAHNAYEARLEFGDHQPGLSRWSGAARE